MAYKGPNLVEWEGNVSILEKSFETIFPCLFLQDRQGGWSSLNKEFPLTKWTSTKSPNLKPAALLADKRNMALVEEALDAVEYTKKQIDTKLVDENTATKSEQDGLLAFKHLSNHKDVIIRRMEVEKQFTVCNGILDQFKNVGYDSKTQCLKLSYQLSSDKDKKENIATECLKKYNEYTEIHKSFLESLNKFKNECYQLHHFEDPSEYPFLNNKVYMEKWTIGNQPIKDYLESQESKWESFLQLDNNGKNASKEVTNDKKQNDYTLFTKRLKNFRDLMEKIDKEVKSEDTIEADILEHIRHITSIRNQLEQSQVEFDLKSGDIEILNDQCPKLLKDLNKQLSSLQDKKRSKEELKKSEHASNLRALGTIQLTPLTGFHDYLAWRKSQKYLNTHVDPFKRAACLLSTLKNPDDIARCKNIYSYNELLEILQNKYAKLPKLIPAMMARLRRLPNPTNTASMKDNISIILNTYTQLKSISEAAVAHFDATVVEDLVLKLTFSYQLKWEEFLDQMSTEDFSGIKETPDDTATDIFDSTPLIETESNLADKIKRTKFIYFIKKVETHLGNVSARSINLDNQTKPNIHNKPKIKNKKQNKPIGSYSTQVDKICVACDTQKPHINKISKKPTKSLASCPTFKEMTLDERKKVVMSNNLCHFCLSPSHKAFQCKYDGSCIKCNKGKHSYLLCHNEAKQTNENSNVTESVEANSVVASNTLLFVGGAEIEDKSSKRFTILNTLFDNASTDSFILESDAQRLGYVGRKVNLNIGRVGMKPESISVREYLITLKDNYNCEHHIPVYSVPRLGYRNKITSNVLYKIAQIFKIKKSDLNNPHGKISLLIGAQHINLFPEPIEYKEKLGLYRSKIGKPLMVIGSIEGIQQESTCNFIDVNSKSFWLGDSLGLNQDPKCSTCLKAPACKSCKLLNLPISFQEQQDAILIKESMKFDFENKSVSVSYPYIKNPVEVFPPEKTNKPLATKLARNLKRSLDKDGLTKIYTEQFEDMLNRGVLIKLSDEACRRWEADHGPVNYVSHHAVLKDTSATTKCRSVCNSSLSHNGTSLNSILPKGPSSISNLLHVIMRFRSKPFVLVADLKKAYNTIKTSLLDCHLRRLLWYDSNDIEGNDPQLQTYGMTTVAFGDTPAQYILEVAKMEISNYCKDILKNEDLSLKILNESYVDDLVFSFDALLEAEAHKEQLPIAFGSLGFKLKEIIIAGENVENDVEAQHLFGHLYHFDTDQLQIKFIVNISKKKRNQRVGPNLNSMSDLSNIVLTKRTVMSLLGSQYDPLGLASVFLSKYKIFLHQLHKKEYEMDEPLNAEDTRVGMKLLKELITASETSLLFNRSNHPEGYKLEELVCFADASTQCLQVVLYGIYRNDNKQTYSSLISGKNKIVNSTVPRNELNSLVAAVRLTKNYIEAIGIENITIKFISDSTCALDMLSNTFVTRDIYLVNRINEIRHQVKRLRVCSKFYWCESSLNIADYGTRGLTKFEFLQSDTWKFGPEWLKNIKNEIVLKHTFDNTNDDSKEIESFHTDIKVLKDEKFDPFEKLLNNTNSLIKVLRSMCIIKAILKKKTFKIKTSFTVEEMYEAFLNFVKKAQSEIEITGLKTKQLMIFEHNNIKYTSLRLTDESIKFVFNQDKLPILSSKTRFAKLLLQYAHESENMLQFGKLHVGNHQTLVNSRCGIYGAWITHAKQAIKGIINNCVKCKYMNKKIQTAPMADRNCEFGTIPQDGSCFNHIAMDYFGPLPCKTPKHVQTRSTKTYNIYGLAILCQQTRGVAIYTVEGYDTQSFIVAFKQHCAIRGVPRTVLSDPMSSFISGSKLVKENKDNIDEKDETELLKEFNTNYNINWKFIPAGSQWRDPAERTIKSIKQIFKSIDFLNNKIVLTISEYNLLFSEICEILNRRPISAKMNDDDIDFICPNSLMLGRTSKFQPIISPPSIEAGKQRINLIDNLKKSFWKRLMGDLAASANLFKTQNWYHQNHEPQVGDIVLLCYKNKIEDGFKIAKVIHVHDNKRDVDLLVASIQNGKVNSFKTAVKMLQIPVQRTVLLLSINPKEDDNKKDDD